MLRPIRSIVMRSSALALCVCAWAAMGGDARGQQSWTSGAGTSSPYQMTAWNNSGQYGNSPPVPAAIEMGAWDGTVPMSQPTPVADSPPPEQWIAAPADRSPYVDAQVYGEPAWDGRELMSAGSCDEWCLQVLPDGLIYHSYWAGVHEPRLALTMFGERDGRSMWDATLGGRAGLWRYGTTGAFFPQGWQLDVEAAAMVRLDLDDIRDMNTVDYRGGIPLTYGVENWQFKIGYYHLSSHLADEFAINNPGSLDDRINYVRDSLVAGASYYPHPFMRLYGEIGYAFYTDGGAEPLEFQFGTELAKAGPTGPRGTPFFAANAHLREEVDFGGDINLQAGWLWRGNSSQVMRIGAFYFNGKSSQYQTFNDSEEQIGVGLWYDF
jgi:hypothetical protein